MDQGTRGEPVSLAGTYWRLERLPMHPGPVQQPRPPVWVAAQGPYSLRTAALHADVLVTMGDVGDQPPATLPKLRQRFERLSEICTDVGRDPTRCVARTWSVGRTTGLSNPRPLRDFVHAFADVGVTDFMFGLSGARASLEETAASLESLRAVASGEVGVRQAPLTCNRRPMP